MVKIIKQDKYKTVLLWVIGVISYYIWFQALYNTLKFDNLFPYASTYRAVRSIINNLTAIGVIFLLNYVTVFKIIRIKNMRYKVIGDVILSFVWAILINYTYLTLHGLYRTVTVDWIGTLLNNMLILLFVEWVFYFQNYVQSCRNIEITERKNIQYRYDVLKSQINPHFLFNSLNLLSSLISIDPRKATKFTISLAAMYRYILANNGKNIISLKEELEFLSSYITILKMRYKDKFNIIFDGETHPNMQLVPYTLQLLIENVTKHNIISTQYPMEVRISINPGYITVSNPIVRRKVLNSEGIGLNYLKELYASHGQEFTVVECDNIFIARVPLI